MSPATLSPANRRARSERSKALRREVLLKAALEQFYQNGYVATRMDDIAADAGFSKGTLYLYFASKEALFEALIAEIALPKIAAFEAGLSQLDSLAAEVDRFFERVVRRTLRYAEERRIDFSGGLLVAVSGGADYALHKWDAATGRLLAAWPGHTNGIRQVAASPNGRLLATASKDKTVIIWHVVRK